MELKSTQQYWFYLSPKVYMVDGSSIFLYHTESGAKLDVADPVACTLLRTVYDPENMGVVDFPKHCKENSAVLELISLGMGGIIPKDNGKVKPLNFLPILNLQKDIDKAKDRGELEFVLENALQYLSRLYLLLSLPNDSLCTQFLTRATPTVHLPGLLPLECIAQALKQSRHAQLQAVEIYVDGNPKDIYWDTLAHILAQYPYAYSLHTTLTYYKEIRHHFPPNTLSTVVCLCKPGELESIAPRKLDNVHINTLVSSSKELEEAFHHIERLGIQNYQLTPIFNGSNLPFLTELVFFTEEELLSEPITMREIFRNQKLNAQAFGELYLLPNTEWRAIPTGNSLGKIDTTPMVKAIYYELLHNTAWRKIRACSPCRTCKYRYICPPVGSLERAIGRENLCHMAC